MERPEYKIEVNIIDDEDKEKKTDIFFVYSLPQFVIENDVKHTLITERMAAIIKEASDDDLIKTHKALSTATVAEKHGGTGDGVITFLSYIQRSAIEATQDQIAELNPDDPATHDERIKLEHAIVGRVDYPTPEYCINLDAAPSKNDFAGRLEQAKLCIIQSVKLAKELEDKSGDLHYELEKAFSEILVCQIQIKRFNEILN